ncbi:hypothetical protein, partial [Glutamicibacter arilaitensis]|uniref:hypothetical protein n=1 Tax=Glutamicibacter arilaitensis TaxID=256701 RepID=UPI003F94F8D2
MNENIFHSLRIGLRIFVVTLAGAGKLPFMPFELTGCQGSEQHQNPVFSGKGYPFSGRRKNAILALPE